MNEITQYFTALLKELEAGRDVESVTVTESLGSAPRGAGARMLVGQKGRICGTVGGGPIEYLAEREAGALLRNRRSISRQYDLSDRSSQVGMICGGTITAAFHYIDAGREDLREVCRAALHALKAPGALWIVLELPPLVTEEADVGEQADGKEGITCPDDVIRNECIWLYSLERNLDSRLPAASEEENPNSSNSPKLDAEAAADLNAAAPPPRLLSLIKERCQSGRAGLFKTDGRSFYLEPIASDSLVHVFGGGHVARELVPLLSNAGFSCAVYDDREEYLKREDFPDAFGTALVSFERLSGCLFPAGENYFVIMTRGHQFDLQAQAFAMKQPSLYVGVMGSRRKKAMLTRGLLEMGFTQEKLNSVHAPIGLDIGAETPAEIAVSIAAELIRIRNKNDTLKKSHCREEFSE